MVGVQVGVSAPPSPREPLRGPEGPPGKPGPQGDPGPPGDPAELLGALAPGEALTVDSEGQPSSLLAVSRDELATRAAVLGERLSATDSRVGADPTGESVSNEAIATWVQMVEQSDGGEGWLPPGQYRIDHSTTQTDTGVASPSTWTQTIMSGTYAGVRGESHLYLDPASTPQAMRHILLRLGTKDQGTTGPVTIRDISITGNQGVIGGGSVLGIAARHDAASALTTAHSDDVLVEHCRFEDVAVAVGCMKSGGTAAGTSDRLNSQFQRWSVVGCHVVGSHNKAVELQECTDGLIRDVTFIDCVDGPQTIFFSRRCTLDNVHGTFTQTGLNVTHGCEDITIINPMVAASGSTAAGAAAPALKIRTEPVASSSTTIRGLTVIGGVLRSRVGTSLQRAVVFETRPEVTAATFERIAFRGVDMDGQVVLHDPLTAAKTTIQDVLFDGCRFRGPVNPSVQTGGVAIGATPVATVAQGTCMVRRVRFRDNVWDQAATLALRQADVRDDVFTAGLTAAAGSAIDIRRGISASTWTDNSTDTLGTSANVYALT